MTEYKQPKNYRYFSHWEVESNFHYLPLIPVRLSVSSAVETTLSILRPGFGKQVAFTFCFLKYSPLEVLSYHVKAQLLWDCHPGEATCRCSDQPPSLSTAFQLPHQGTRHDNKAILDPADQSTYEQNATKWPQSMPLREESLCQALPRFLTNQIMRYDKKVIILSH